MPDNIRDVSAAEAEVRAQKKAKLAQVLSRGAVSDRLAVKDADPNRHYEWCRNTTTDIDRWKALGFRVEQEKGRDSKLHGTGDGRILVGDAVLMSTSKENFELLDEVKGERKEKRARMNAKREYVDRMRRANPLVPVLDPLGEGEVKG